MNKYLYRKTKKTNYKKILRVIGFLIFLISIIGSLYTFLPLISWQVYFAPVFASQNITAPIPRTTIVNPTAIKSLFSNAANNFTGTDYSNAQNWFPKHKAKRGDVKLTSYTLSIPKLGIKDAFVTTVDNELDKHLVNFAGTAVPPDNGNAVIYGHSSLPQLFEPYNYKTIFATLYKLKTGDDFSVNVENIIYNYKIRSIRVTDPEDTSVFTQDYDISHITLVTCTPPGTTWKRLIIKADLEKI